MLVRSRVKIRHTPGRQLRPVGNWRADGWNWYGNRPVNETSPYLLQHQHNPLDWYPGGEEALARSGDEQRPIFLSIGQDLDG